MTKEEFRKLLIPLSKKEKEYQKHPQLSKNFYQGLNEKNPESGQVYHFDMNSELFSISHGEILPNTNRPYSHTSLHFSKQTRFSHVPVHSHHYIEMNYVYSGCCTAIINGTSIQLETGDVCIMDVEVVHTIASVQENDTILNCIMEQDYFNRRFTERLANSGVVAKFIADVLNKNSRHNQYIVFHTSDSRTIRDMFEEAFCEYLDPGICSKTVIDSYMTVIFIQLARCYQMAKEQEYHNSSRSYMTEILRYIEEHCADCTLAETADRFNFHPNYLSRAIKKDTGKTFKDVVIENRLAQAAFLLKNTPRSISDIAAGCGWSNLKQFYKKFEETYECPPKEYRKKTESQNL